MNDASIALVNGRVMTFDASDSVAEALYIERGADRGGGLHGVGARPRARRRARWSTSMADSRCRA